MVGRVAVVVGVARLSLDGRARRGRRGRGGRCGTSRVRGRGESSAREGDRGAGSLESRRSRARGGARATTDALTELASVIVPSAEAFARD